MSRSAFQKIRQGLEEAQAYMEGKREGYRVTKAKGITLDEFMALKALENQRVRFTFHHGQSFTARLLSVTSDFDQSQHLVYDQIEGVSALEDIACYAAGEELLSCVDME